MDLVLGVRPAFEARLINVPGMLNNGFF